MAGYPSYNPRTIDQILKDFKARRTAIVKALTTDVDDFYQQCDPEKENLCLYGYPNEQWEVSLPAEEVPSELPEPVLGINFARDGMREKEWLALVAVHSDTWLIAIAFFLAARFGLQKDDRKRLFNLMQELPSCFEVVSGMANNQSKGPANSSSKKTKSNSKAKQSKVSQPKYEEDDEDETEDEGDADAEDSSDDVEDDQEETQCGACDETYSSDQFWICCDICQKWYHGKCVKITPARAEHIKQYKCPVCCNKRARG